MFFHTVLLLTITCAHENDRKNPRTCLLFPPLFHYPGHVLVRRPHHRRPQAIIIYYKNTIYNCFSYNRSSVTIIIIIITAFLFHGRFYRERFVYRFSLLLFFFPVRLQNVSLLSRVVRIVTTIKRIQIDFTMFV